MNEIFKIASGILLALAMIYIGGYCWEAISQFRNDLHYVKLFSKGSF